MDLHVDDGFNERNDSVESINDGVEIVPRDEFLSMEINRDELDYNNVMESVAMTRKVLGEKLLIYFLKLKIQPKKIAVPLLFRFNGLTMKSLF